MSLIHSDQGSELQVNFLLDIFHINRNFSLLKRSSVAHLNGPYKHCFCMVMILDQLTLDGINHNRKKNNVI